MNEPRKAIDAVLETDFTTEDGLTIHPLTLGRYALLELVESPFATGSEFTLVNTIPSVYVMSQPLSEVAGYDSKNVRELKAKALEWADSMEFRDYAKAIDLIARRIELMNDAAPKGTSGDGGDGKNAKPQKKSRTAS